MICYIFRRIVYGFFILLGVNALTFALFFAVNTPDDMARLSIGGRYVTQQAIDSWKKERGYDVPLIFNSAAEGTGKFTETIFFRRSAPLLAGDFGLSDTGRSINTEIKERAPASLALALPTFLLGVFVSVSFALILVMVRRTRLEWAGVAMSVTVMSISALFYIIVGQWLFSKTLRWVPVSGFSEGVAMAAFLVLPVAIGVFTRLGGEALLYRSMFLEESEKDYVRTARAKGVSEMRVLFRHVLGNAMLPVITSTVAVIPMLFMGSLIMENFFGIPGLGSYTIDAINAQDFSVVRAMVFLGTAAYILGLILTDVAYTVVDPRIRLK
ncbi:ABC transporter permease [Duodenibacillus massiliensis]|uniref:ABC transporter permease n=1 Tax=Duodenibacillus massiliensis TaxID=1852381 RepID=UPI003079A039